MFAGVLDNIASISFLCGIALIVIAVLGGGLEIREIKIPRLGRFVRGAIATVGVALLLIGAIDPFHHESVGQTNSQTDNESRPSPGERVEVLVKSELEGEESAENLELLIDSQEIGALHVDKHTRTDTIKFALSQGLHGYVLRGHAYYSDGEAKAELDYYAFGQNFLLVKDGSEYQVQRGQPMPRPLQSVNVFLTAVPQKPVGRDSGEQARKGSRPPTRARQWLQRWLQRH